MGCGLMVRGCGFNDGCGFKLNLVVAGWWVVGLGHSGSGAWWVVVH